MKGGTYFKKWQFSINEGGRYANIHINLKTPGFKRPGIYLCIGGFQFVWGFSMYPKPQRFIPAHGSYK